MSSRITAPMRIAASRSGLRLGDPAGAAGVSGVATGSVADGSLDKLPSTHRSAASAALVPCPIGLVGGLVDRLEEPVDQSVDHHRPGTRPEEEAEDHEDRVRSELKVRPVPDQRTEQGRDEE